MTQKKLTRSATDRKIAGICGGLGEYLNVDPIVFRIIFLFLLICGGSGFLLYVLMWILIPEKKNPAYVEIQSEENEPYEVVEEDTNDSPHPKKSMKKHHGGIFWGLLFVVIGVLWLGDSFDLFDFSWHNIFKLWPLFIVWLGVLLLPIGHIWKVICNFIILIIAVFLLFFLPVRSCCGDFWRGYSDGKEYVITKKISTSDCCIEMDEDDIDTEMIVVTANGDSIVIDQKAQNKEEKVIIKKVKR